MQVKWTPSRNLIKVGDQFSFLTVVKCLGSVKSGQHTMFCCLCSCGNTVIVRGSGLLQGHNKSCGCKKIISAKIKKVRPGVSSLKSCYSLYRRGAVNRNLSFDLSMEQFSEITHQNCFYCGKEPSNNHLGSNANGAYLYNGIDRIDNNKGYNLDNIVPCCKRCNFMKSSMGYGDFIDHIVKIYKNLSEDNIILDKSQMILRS